MAAFDPSAYLWIYLPYTTCNHSYTVCLLLFLFLLLFINPVLRCHFLYHLLLNKLKPYWQPTVHNNVTWIFYEIFAHTHKHTHTYNVFFFFFSFLLFKNMISCRLAFACICICMCMCVEYIYLYFYFVQNNSI